ncbi:FtsX-like permease family protein, partial [candidate division KSB3 bacterium]|nr:FtsX-like permease family protein [candidate division KSB3 bacterium]MBD3323503.1 FtsX-like permease family protein [candidate division KSB3 bacterium]
EYVSGTGFPFIWRYYKPAAFALTFFYSIGFPILAIGLPIRKIFTMQTAAMIATGVETNSGTMTTMFMRSNFFRIGKRWNRLLERKVLLRIGLRNVWRRKFFFVFSTLCIVLSLAFSVATLLTNTSIYQTVNDFLDRGQWELFVQFIGHLDPPNVAQLQHIDGISAVDPYRKGFVKLGVADTVMPYRILGISTAKTLMGVDLIEGRFFSSDEAHEIILNEEMKNTLGLELGDLVEVSGKEQALPLTLVGTMNNLTGGQGLAPLLTTQSLLSKHPNFSGALLTVHDPIEAVEARLYHTDNVGYVVRKSQARETLHISMGKLSNFLYKYCTLSLVVSVLLIFINLYLNVIDRETEYAVLLANGFGKHEISRMISYEVLVMMIVVMLATVPLAVLFAKLICLRIAETAMNVHLHLQIRDFLIILLPGLLLMLGVTAYCVKVAMEVNVPTAIRNRILG